MSAHGCGQPRAARLRRRSPAQARRRIANDELRRAQKFVAYPNNEVAALTSVLSRRIIYDVDDEVIAKEVSGLGEKVRSLERRMAEVEQVNARLEDAALTTARAMEEISTHWDAVYEAMRRAEVVDPEDLV
jgi:hypothetical protein